MDMAGNVWEWVDWTVSLSDQANTSSGGGGCSACDFVNFNTNIETSNVMSPDSWQASDTSLTAADGIGKYYSGATNGAAYRGGRSTLEAATHIAS